MRKIGYSFIAGLLIIALINSCHAHRDCRGKKKVAKTQMGGWL